MLRRRIIADSGTPSEVLALLDGVNSVGSMPNTPGEPLPQQGRARTRGRHRDEVHALAGERLAPAVEDVGHLLDAPEPLGHLGAALGVAEVLQEAGVGLRPAVLDVLLPLRGDLADQVAGGEDEVDLGLGGPQGLECPGDLHARGRPEDLVADDRGARPLADLGGQPVPGADGLVLESAPGQLHQVERGQEVGVVAVGGVEDAALAQRVPVGEQDVLHEGGAGLGGADVQEHASGHGVPPCRRQVRRQAATASSRVRVRSTVPDPAPGSRSGSAGTSSSGLPCTE